MECGELKGKSVVIPDTVGQVVLAAHPLIRTCDLDDAREKVGRVFCPHQLTLSGPPGQCLDLRHNRVSMGGMSLHYIDYGAAVRIVPGELTSFYLVQIPLRGAATIRCGTESVVSTHRMAAVPNPTEALDMEWGRDNPHLVVHIPRRLVEDALVALTGLSAQVPLRFALGMDLTSGSGRQWMSLLEVLLADAEGGFGRPINPLVHDRLEDALILSLVASQPSNYSSSIDGYRAPCAPRAVRAAISMCEDAADEPLTVTCLAYAAGVSVRTLQEGFRRHVGMTPMEYLKEVRLRRARDELLNGSSQMTVTDVAYRWGFNHLGRFARLYRKRFGELPSDTRRA